MPMMNILGGANIDPDADPYFSQLVFLQNWAGNAGDAAPTVELSPKARAITNTGSVILNGDNSISFNGTNQVLSLATLAAANMPGDFCVDGFFAAHTLTPDASIVSWGPMTADTDMKLEVSANNKYVVLPDGSSPGLAYAGPANAVIDQMVHIAFHRISGTFYMKINGVNISGTPVASGGNKANGKTMRIGNLEGQSLWYNGKVGPLRVTNGNGRYPTGNFTPPAYGPFPVR